MLDGSQAKENAKEVRLGTSLAVAGSPNVLRRCQLERFHLTVHCFLSRWHRVDQQAAPS